MVLPRPEGTERPVASLGARGRNDVWTNTQTGRYSQSSHAIVAALTSFSQESLPWREMSKVGAK